MDVFKKKHPILGELSRGGGGRDFDQNGAGGGKYLPQNLTKIGGGGCVIFDHHLRSIIF